MKLARLGFMVKIFSNILQGRNRISNSPEPHEGGMLLSGNVQARVSHITLSGSMSPKSNS